jgi:rhamnosyltransferase
MKASVVIRTYNEARYLPEVLEAVRRQRLPAAEVILVDSGSTDGTLEIAKRLNCRILHIAKQDFSFGRSLNIGCEAAVGDVLVFISGHCVPAAETWLEELIRPISDGVSGLSYGCQRGGPESRFSEHQVFAKFFPEQSAIPQAGFFCNNANAAVRKSLWGTLRFDESLTGLEDLDFAKRLLARGERVAYVATASVYHYHHEDWATIRRRYERESIALQYIMPEIHISWLDLVRYFAGAVVHDVRVAGQLQRLNLKLLYEIIRFRLAQFGGSYRGNHEHKQLSQRRKEEYFYPSQSGYR